MHFISHFVVNSKCQFNLEYAPGDNKQLAYIFTFHIYIYFPYIFQMLNSWYTHDDNWWKYIDYRHIGINMNVYSCNIKCNSLFVIILNHLLFWPYHIFVLLSLSYSRLTWNMASNEAEGCLFNCGKSKENLISAKPQCLRTIIDSSKIRSDGLHVELEHRLADDPNTALLCHKSCVLTYTSKTHIKRFVEANSNESSGTPPPKRTCRSEISQFDFLTHYRTYFVVRCVNQPPTHVILIHGK